MDLCPRRLVEAAVGQRYGAAAECSSQRCFGRGIVQDSADPADARCREPGRLEALRQRIAGAEMAMRDVGIKIQPGSGVGAAEEYWRSTAKPLGKRDLPPRAPDAQPAAAAPGAKEKATAGAAR